MPRYKPTLIPGRYCFHVAHEDKDETGEYRPHIVREGDPNRYPLDETWGAHFSAASAAAEHENDLRGLTTEDVKRIVTSSMDAARLVN